MKKVAGRLRLDLSQYRELEAFSQFGSDLDPDTQKTLARGERLVATLNQKERSPLVVQDQVIQIFAATNGYLDRINVDRIPEYLEALGQRAHSEVSDLLEQMGQGKWDDSVTDALESFVTDFTDDFGCDLDEEGQPMERGESDRVKQRGGDGEDEEGGGERSEDGGPRSEGEGEGSEEESREEEPARA